MVDKIILTEKAYEKLVKYAKITADKGIEFAFKIIKKFYDPNRNAVIIEEIEKIKAVEPFIEIKRTPDYINIGHGIKYKNSSEALESGFHTHPAKFVDVRYFDPFRSEEVRIDELKRFAVKIYSDDVGSFSNEDKSILTKKYSLDRESIYGVVSYIGGDNILMNCVYGLKQVPVYYEKDGKLIKIPRNAKLSENFDLILRNLKERDYGTSKEGVAEFFPKIDGKIPKFLEKCEDIIKASNSQDIIRALNSLFNEPLNNKRF